MSVDKTSFVRRLGSWLLPPRMHTLCWVLVSLAFFVWVCGDSPGWIKYWLPPMPHTLRNLVAPLIALIATLILSSFISTVLYKDIDPSSPYTYFDQSVPKYLFQIVVSLLVGFAVYPVIWLFSDWFGWFNYLFAFGLGSFIYIVIDSSYVKVSAPRKTESVSRPNDAVTVIDHRGQLPAENHEWSGWLKGLITSPPERIKRRIAREEKKKELAAPELKYLAQGAVELLVSSGLKRIGIKYLELKRLTKEAREFLASKELEKLGSEASDKLELGMSGQSKPYEAGSWRDKSLEHNRERVTGAKPKGKDA